jgi:hypothetical protein
MDKQVTELVGRSKLVAELLHSGIEVAIPERDRGIDLIAYLDLDSRASSFVARPIQMKASSGEQFSIERKYAKFRDLILAFVWHVHDPAPSAIYALTYREALNIGKTMGWTKKDSWINNGRFTTQRPSKKLVGLLQPYRMSANLWRGKMMGRKPPLSSRRTAPT